MKRLSFVLAALACFVVVASCGSGVSSGSDSSTDATVEPDATDDGLVKPDGVLPDLVLPDLDDATPAETDALPPDACCGPDGDADEAEALSCEPPYAGFGCACESGDDCASNYCVETNTGDVCSTTCTDECEAAGWTCAEVKNTCPDCVYICVFQALTLCTPCTTDDDCAAADVTLNARCVSYGPAGSFCGSPCVVDGECPEGYACDEVPLPGGATTTQCVLQQGLCACSPSAIEQAASTACHVQNEFGQCPGTRACTATGLSACDGATPAAEACNDADDDCDGAIDEDIAAQPCALTNEIGSCPGQKTCEDGSWTCTGSAPAEETCNGKDDDCDGLTDNAFGDLDADGLADCVDPDDDDDGVPDDGNLSGTIGDAPCAPGQATACDDNCTQVANAGQADYDKDGKGDGCDCDADGDNYLSTAPGCNGDDCFDLDKTRNPSVIEEPVAGDACRWCNAIDDNCDGQTDESCPDADADGPVDCVDPDDDNDGVPDLADNCPFASNQAQSNLDGDLQGDACDADADGDTIENGADNCPFTPNTDQADSDDDGDGDACDGDRDGDGDPDETDCAPSDPEAHHGALEVCNGHDDDCDALVDADDVGTETGCVGADCNTPLQIVPCDLQEGLCSGCQKRPDQCAYGEWLPCQGADYAACDEDYELVETWCDGADNDCNGVVDEGHAVIDWNGEERQLGQACGTGTCAGGTAVCHPERWTAICSSRDLASPEACNGADDDCDGLTDEDFAFADWNGASRKVGQACGVGVCDGGVVVCQPDGAATLCTTSGMTAPETCNALDDDCDGKVDAQDSDLAANDQPLCEKQAGVCEGSRKAPTLCVGGFWLSCGELDYWYHDLNYHHGVEASCDGLDNDCDTQTDEGYTYTDWNGQVLGLFDTCGTGACAGGTVLCHDYVEAWCTSDGDARVEACDGVDDDCDGQVDEGFAFTDWNGANRAVGEGCGTGACAGGVVTCDALANAAVCSTAGGAIETCNGVDDDCDGQIDEGFTFTDWNGQVRTLHAACGTGACADGEVVCNGAGDGTACDTAGLAGPERCNNADDDCDGKLDANDPDLLTNDHPTCENTSGVCVGCAKPTSRCVGGTWLPCGDLDYAACTTSFEAGTETSCDGLDNNCNGAVDEAFLLSDWNSQVRGVGQSCGTGACFGGAVVCNAAKTGAVCSSAGLVGLEACNGADDDCDGGTDEGFTIVDWNGLAKAVGQGCGTGACAGGLVACDVANNVAACSSAGNTGSESCDGVDNDCDGAVDEGYSLIDWNGLVRALGTGCGTGACANGEVVCNAAHNGATCDTAVNAGAETCNGADDDCDGKVDAADADLLTHDHPGCELQAGVCAGCTKTASLCSGGTWLPCGATRYEACNPAYEAGAETLCDQLDNDCSGQTDEDFSDDVDNCGACGIQCTNDHGSTSCDDGKCLPSCAGGYKSCDGWTVNGCETSLRTLTNCGDCDRTCALTNAVETCQAGVCEISACDAGHCDYDGLDDGGCEYDLDLDPVCASRTDIGSVSGDTSPASNAVQFSSRGEKWLQVFVSEDDNGCDRLSATITLTPAAGTNYNLSAFCSDCTTSAGSSQNGGATVDTVTVRWNEACICAFGVCVPTGSDSDRYINVRVSYADANTCGEWQVRVVGDTNASTNTCSEL